MSAVSNVILKTTVSEDRAISQLNKKFSSGKPFVSCDDENLPCGWYGGSKMLECAIFPASFNFLNKEELVEAIESIKWEWPESVQLFIQGQEDEKLEEIKLNL